MCGEFGEVTVIIGLVINFLAFVSPLLTLRDTLTYAIWMKESMDKMISHHISISCQNTEIAGWCGVGEKEASLTASLVHVQDQLRGWCHQYDHHD